MRSAKKEELRFKCDNINKLIGLEDSEKSSKAAYDISNKAEDYYINKASAFRFNKKDLNAERSISNQLKSCEMTYKSIATIIVALFAIYDSAKEIDENINKLLSIVELPKQSPDNKSAIKGSKEYIELITNRCIQIKRLHLNIPYEHRPEIKFHTVENVKDTLGNEIRKPRWKIDLHVIEKGILKGVELNQDSEIGYSKIQINKADIVLKDSYSYKIGEPDSSSIFNYVGALDRFGLSIPISLIKKLAVDEWKAIKFEILKKEDNTTGIISDFINHDEQDIEIQVLRLSENGKKDSEAIEFDDRLILQILNYCDVDELGEKQLFNKLTIKKRFFKSIFRDFDYDLKTLIDTKHPSSFKEVLLYRLMGFYYADINNYEEMHKNFKKCITLLKENSTTNSSSFYLNWADVEKKFNHNEVALRIYKDVLKDLPLPKNKNRSARFQLTLNYINNRDTDEALNLWAEMDYYLVRDEGFVPKFHKHIKNLIDNNQSKQASQLQNFLSILTKHLTKNGLSELSKNILKQINERITNNSILKIALVRLHIYNKSESALEEIKNLENDGKIYPLALALLYIDYYRINGNIPKALWYGDTFIESNKELNIDRLYIKLGNICVANSDYKRAKNYFELIKDESYLPYQYAITLDKCKPKINHRIIGKYYKKYFDSHPNSVSTKAIGVYVTYCIKYEKWNDAAQLIFDKVNQINSNDRYNDYFISFLYQQQLRLTTNPVQAESLLTKAIEYATTNKQIAIVYSNYARQILHNRNWNNPSPLDIAEANEYFIKSYNHAIRRDDKLLVTIVKNHFNLNEYNSCLKKIAQINDPKYYFEATSIQLHVLLNQKRFSDIQYLSGRLKIKRLKGLAFFYLTKNFKDTIRNRKAYFKKAIELNYDPEIKFQYSIFLYKTKAFEDSELILEELKDLYKNDNQRFELQNRYIEETGNKKGKVYQKIINSIKHDVYKLTEKSLNMNFRLDNLIIKFPYDIRVYNIKFKYLLKFKQFEQCSELLELLISKDLITQSTKTLFFNLAEVFYDYSNYNNFKNPKMKQRQIQYLNMAYRYIGYAAKVKYSEKIAALHCLIIFKQGNIKTYNKTVSYYSNKLENSQKLIFLETLDKKKALLHTFLWSTESENYYDTLMFYRSQEKLAAMIIGDNNQKDKTNAILILKSISQDYEFNQRNNFVLLTQVTNRLGYCYYYHEQNYDKAFKYSERIYKRKKFDPPFIRGFLKTIDNVNFKNINKKIEYGISVIEFYLQYIEIATIYKFYGKWLMESGKYKEAFDKYGMALSLETNGHYRTMLYVSIINLCYESLVVESDPFLEVNQIKSLANDSFKKIMDYDSNFPESDKALRLLNFIKAKEYS